MRHPLLVTLPLFAIDQLTKWLVIARLPLETDEGIATIPGFYGVPVWPRVFHLVHWGNTGSAFGMFKNGNVPFIVLSVATFIGLLVALRRGAFREPLSRWAIALLMAGLLGNLADRVLHGHVVDFLLFYLHIPGANPWPAFNVADSCIFIAVALFLLAAFREDRLAAKPVNSAG